MDDTETLIASGLTAVCVGWFSKVVATLTDPLIEAMTQDAIRLGWLAVIVIIAFLVKSAFDDLKGYVAMGVYAIPAIIVYLLPWDSATLLLFLAAVGLGLMGRKVVFNWRAG